MAKRETTLVKKPNETKNCIDHFLIFLRFVFLLISSYVMKNFSFVLFSKMVIWIILTNYKNFYMLPFVIFQKWYFYFYENVILIFLRKMTPSTECQFYHFTTKYLTKISCFAISMTK